MNLLPGCRGRSAPRHVFIVTWSAALRDASGTGITRADLLRAAQARESCEALR
jgi:hypothetical protein